MVISWYGEKAWRHEPLLHSYNTSNMYYPHNSFGETWCVILYAQSCSCWKWKHSLSSYLPMIICESTFCSPWASTAVLYPVAWTIITISVKHKVTKHCSYLIFWNTSQTIYEKRHLYSKHQISEISKYKSIHYQWKLFLRFFPIKNKLYKHIQIKL